MIGGDVMETFIVITIEEPMGFRKAERIICWQMHAAKIRDPLRRGNPVLAV